MREREAAEMEIFVREAELNEEILGALIEYSEAWEKENSCFGYRRNDKGDIEGRRIFIAETDGEIVGYLFGQNARAEKASSVMAAGMEYFEIEELYIAPAMRSKGVGGRLFRLAEETVKGEGTEYICLSTATKNFRAILHFYIDEMGMEFWSARLFKKI